MLYTQATSSQAFAHTVREGRERIIDLVARLLRAGTRNPEPDTDFDMMAVALVGAGEAVATRVSTGDADVGEAAELMINLFWRGLKGKARPTRIHSEAAPGRVGVVLTDGGRQPGLSAVTVPVRCGSPFEVAQRQLPAVGDPVDVQAGARGQHHRLAEAHRVPDGIGQLTLDVAPKPPRR